MSVGTHSYVSIHAQQSMGHGLWTPTATPTSSAEGFGITQFDPSLSPNTTSNLPQSALQRDNNVPSHALGAQQGYHGPILDYSNDAQNSNLRELPQNTHMASSYVPPTFRTTTSLLILANRTQGHPHAYCVRPLSTFKVFPLLYGAAANKKRATRRRDSKTGTKKTRKKARTTAKTTPTCCARTHKKRMGTGTPNRSGRRR
jgi:hypothetical protein